MKLQTYIVIETDSSGNKRICFDGPKPFIGEKSSAQRLANFLASLGTRSQYTLATIRMTQYKGTVE